MFSGCPEAIKVLVGNKCDLTPEVDLSQAKVSSSARSRPSFLSKLVCSQLECMTCAVEYSPLTIVAFLTHRNMQTSTTWNS